MAFLNTLFRRTNMVNRRQKKVGTYGTRVAAQRTTLNKLDANRANLNRVAKEIADTRESIAQYQRQFAQLRETYAKKYTQYKKNTRRVLGNNWTVMAKLGSGAQKILAMRHKNMNKKNTELHNNSQKVIGKSGTGAAPRVPMNMGTNSNAMTKKLALRMAGGAKPPPMNVSGGNNTVVVRALRGDPPPK